MNHDIQDSPDLLGEFIPAEEELISKINLHAIAVLSIVIAIVNLIVLLSKTHAHWNTPIVRPKIAAGMNAILLFAIIIFILITFISFLLSFIISSIAYRNIQYLKKILPIAVVIILLLQILFLGLLIIS